jgi:hypothetical protein
VGAIYVLDHGDSSITRADVMLSARAARRFTVEPYMR